MFNFFPLLPLLLLININHYTHIQACTRQKYFSKTFLIFYLFHDLVLRFTFAYKLEEKKILHACCIFRNSSSISSSSSVCVWFEGKLFLIFIAPHGIISKKSLSVEGEGRSKLTEASLSMGKSYWWTSIKSFLLLQLIPPSMLRCEFIWISPKAHTTIQFVNTTILISSF